MSSHSRPTILVNTDMREIEGYRWHAAIETYVAAVASGAGAVPLLVPALGAALPVDELLHLADGILFTGSRSNVHPARYGVDPAAHHEPFDEARDATTLPLIRAAIARGIPLLAICRGHQELNVAMGGTIQAEVQELEGRFDHRVGRPEGTIDERFDHAHPVRPVPGGRLAAIVGEAPLMVNSLHRQAIARLAEGLVVEAQAEDGTIEAVSVRDARGFALGVQWHPEYWVWRGRGRDAPSDRLFDAFGEAARAFRAAR